MVRPPDRGKFCKLVGEAVLLELRRGIRGRGRHRRGSRHHALRAGSARPLRQDDGGGRAARRRHRESAPVGPGEPAGLRHLRGSARPAHGSGGALGCRRVSRHHRGEVPACGLRPRYREAAEPDFALRIKQTPKVRKGSAAKPAEGCRPGAAIWERGRRALRAFARPASAPWPRRPPCRPTSSSTTPP